MNSQEAAERLTKLLKDKHIGSDDKNAIWTALEALKGNPCSVCIYSPPSAGDGRPCIFCPATGGVRE